MSENAKIEHLWAKTRRVYLRKARVCKEDELWLGLLPNSCS